MEILGALPRILEQLKERGIFINIKGCILIGAHHGQEYELYKHFGIKNLLFYEALEENFKVLTEGVGPEVDLRNVALGNTSGTVEMFLEDRGMSSSILEPAYHLKQYPQIEFNRKAEVNITSRDDEDFDRNKFNFINRDVQGYELEVFKGATKTLESVDLIIAEINKEEMYKDCAKVGDLDKYLQDFGFQRIFEYWQQDGGTYGDGLYLKSAGASNL